MSTSDVIGQPNRMQQVGVEMLRDLFAECDKNNDELLCLSELVNFCDKLNTRLSTSSSVSPCLPPSAIMARQLLGPSGTDCWTKKLSFNDLHGRLSRLSGYGGVQLACEISPPSGEPDTLDRYSSGISSQSSANQQFSTPNAKHCSALKPHLGAAEDARLSRCEIDPCAPSLDFHYDDCPLDTPLLAPPPPAYPSTRLPSREKRLGSVTSSSVESSPTSKHRSNRFPIQLQHPKSNNLLDTRSSSTSIDISAPNRVTPNPPNYPCRPNQHPHNQLAPKCHSSRISLTSNSFLLSTPPAVHKSVSGGLSRGNRWPLAPHLMPNQPPTAPTRHPQLVDNSTCQHHPFSSSSCHSSKSELHKTISMLSVCSSSGATQKQKRQPMASNNVNSSSRVRHQSNQSHRRIHSSGMVTSFGALSAIGREEGIENEAFASSDQPDLCHNDVTLQDNSGEFVPCGVIENAIMEACSSAGLGAGDLGGFSGVDYRETALNEHQQRQLLKHVICTLSGSNTSAANQNAAAGMTSSAEDSMSSGDSSHDEDYQSESLDEVVEQVRSLVLDQLRSQSQESAGVTAEKLACALLLVAQGYSEQLEQHHPNDVINPTASLHYSMTSPISGGLNSRGPSHFVPIGNQVSWMHVFTGAMLESVGVDVCSLQEAQMFKNRVQLELMLTSLLDRVSQEGIESDPKVATALYLLRLIADFAREEIEDVEKHVMSQQQLFKDTVDHFERQQLESDAHLDRVTSQHNAEVKRLKVAQEGEIERLKRSFENEKMQLESEHRHELLKLRTQLDRLNSRNCTLKDKISIHLRESKEQSLTITKLESERKQLLYDRNMLEDTLNKSSHLFTHDSHPLHLDPGGFLHPHFHGGLLSPSHSSTLGGGAHDNPGAVSSPNSTLRWETCSDGSLDRDLLSASVVGGGGERYPILEDDDECSGGGARGGTKGSTIYLYIENEKRKHRNSSQSETHNKVSTFELNEDINEEQRNFSAICCSIVQLTRSFRNTRKQKTHKQSKDKTRTTRTQQTEHQSSHTSYWSKRVSSSSVRKK